MYRRSDRMKELVRLSSRQLSTGATTAPSLLPASYTVTPPIKWPRQLSPKLLVKMMTSEQNLDLALQIFHYAGEYHQGFSHTYYTYVALIRRLAQARAFSAVESLLSDLRSSGIPCEEGVFVAVIRSYGLAGVPDMALNTFVRMDTFRGARRTVWSLNCLLNALVQNGRNDIVRSVFHDCKKRFGVFPNVCTANILIKSLCNRGDMEAAQKLLDEMPALGVVPDAVTYTTLVGGYVSRRDLPAAKRVFREIFDRGCIPDATAYTVLMDGYIKSSMLEDALKLMDEMEVNRVRPNGITYGVMISAYCKAKKSGEALILLRDMVEKRKYIPSATLCCNVFDVLCRQGKVEEACDMWKTLLRKNCEPDSAICSTLIHWLCKEGKVWEAKTLFDEFDKSSVQGVLTYNTLMAGMCQAGELCEAGRLWDDMVGKGRQPNFYTYNVLIKGLCDFSKAREGIKLLEEMLKKKCWPNKSTYKILIDGLRESGNEGDSMEVVSLAISGGKIDSDSWGLFFDVLVGGLDNGVTVLDKVLLDHLN